MENWGLSQRTPSNVPRLPQQLLAIFAGPGLRDVILGDLQEEYGAQFAATSRPAKFWYWKQVARAIPGLIMIRLAKVSPQAIALTLMSTIGGYTLLVLWGAFVTRPFLVEILDSYPITQSIDYLYLYLPIRMLGISLVSAAVTYWVFRANKSFGQNFTSYLAPLLMLMVLPPLFSMFFSSEDYSIGMGIFTLTLDGTALLGGSVICGWIKDRKALK